MLSRSLVRLATGIQRHDYAERRQYSTVYYTSEPPHPSLPKPPCIPLRLFARGLLSELVSDRLR
jgi:hypothetical protein